jgi:tRNA-splicing ligase RtcB
MSYNVILPDKGVPVKPWTRGVQLEDAAQKRLNNVASLPFAHKWVAALPDAHWGSPLSRINRRSIYLFFWN